jgi:hypothetical protein
LAGFHPLNIDITLASEYRLFERQVHPVSYVLSGSRLVGRTTGAPEKGIEYIPKTAERVESIERPVTAAVHAGMTEPIVTGTFLLITENLIGLVNFLELVLGTRGLVSVGVKLHGLSPESATDLFVVRSPFDTEGFVVIDWHKYL